MAHFQCALMLPWLQSVYRETLSLNTELGGNQLKVQEPLKAGLSASLLRSFPSHSAPSILFRLTFFPLQSVHRFLPKRNPKPPFSRLTAWSPPAMEVRASFFFPPSSPCLLSWRCQADSGSSRASLWALCRSLCLPCEGPPPSEPASCWRSQRSSRTRDRPDQSTSRSSKGSGVPLKCGGDMMLRGIGQRRVKKRRCEESFI